MTDAPPERAFATADLPPLCAVFRERPEDFEVDEVPAYLPSGEGTHTWLRIEKRGVSTDEALRGIARRIGRRADDIGAAGLKDAHAVTRQWISIEHLTAEARAGVGDPEGRVRVVEESRHGNKLKMGHLKGNRFRVVLRQEAEGSGTGSGTQSLDLGAARALVARLQEKGVPNFFGMQRFGGEGGRTHLLGRALLRGEAEEFVRLLVGDRTSFPESFTAERTALRVLREGGGPEKVLRAIPKGRKRFYISAAQSAVFNAALAERLGAGGEAGGAALGRLEPGDVAWLHRNGAVFLVSDPAGEQERADRFELSPSGPLPGERCFRAAGEVALREARALAGFGLAPEHFARVPGARRPLRVPLAEAEVASDPSGSLILSFFLPAGSYATAVVSELLQREVG